MRIHVTVKSLFRYLFPPTSLQRALTHGSKKSGGFKEGLLEMDTSVTEVEILVYTEAPFFRISGSGIAGDILIDYPRDNRVFDAFECSGLVQFSYKFSILQTCLKALAVSKKTSLRINEQGLLSLQFMVPQHDAKLTFIEFVVRITLYIATGLLYSCKK